MISVFKKSIGVFGILLFCSCAMTPKTDRMKLMSDDEIHEAIEKGSAESQVYSGLYNVMNLSGTLINSKVREGLLHQQARSYQWDESQMNAEKLKVDEKNKTQTELFLSFYTPERKQDDLNKGQTSWKLFLDVDGKRYEGKATKMKLQTTEIQSLYYHHNRFATPYMISFPVSVASIESKPAVFTITGPSGSTQLKFQQ